MAKAIGDVSTIIQRLAGLRSSLVEHGLDAYIVPRFDAHQGEYCAPHDERLAWLTGFTGSAGLALITQDEAILFVDGRYSVQVREQTSAEIFSYEHLFDGPLECWLQAHARSGWRVGFDAMLLPTSWVKRFEGGAEAAQAQLCPIEENLIDGLWRDQPSKPASEITRMSAQYAGVPFIQKRQQIAETLKAKGCDWLVETQPDGLAWLFNVRATDVPFNPVPHSFAVISKEGQIFWFVSSEKFPHGSDGFGLDDVHILPPEDFLTKLGQLVKPSQRVLIDPDFAPYAANQVVTNAGGVVLLERGPIALAKSIKNRIELEGMANACKADSVAWINTLYWLDTEVENRDRAGDPISEMDVVQRILSERKQIEGFRELSFATIAASDSNGAMCHYSVTEESNAPLKRSSVFLLDSGGQYECGTTDATRTVCFAPVSDEVRKAYTLVLKGHIRLAMLTFPDGTQGHHIDAIARQPLWQHGMDYDHGTGHGVGHVLCVHEGPQRIAKPFSPYDLQPGMIVSNEPGYYEANRFGIRIENLVKIKRCDNGFMGFEDLTLVPIQRSMIDVSLLDALERQWFDDYHARVWAEMSPYFDGERLMWLEKNTLALAPS